MIEVVPLKAEHVEWLRDNGGLGYLANYVEREKLEVLEKTEAYSFLSPIGGVLACAGIVEFWPGRGEVWTMFNPRCRSQFLRLHRILEKILDNSKCNRIEAVVDLDFEPGHRWVRILGFTPECTMEAYNVKGEDAVLYSKVRERKQWRQQPRLLR